MRISYGSARFLELVKSGPKLDMQTIYTMFGERCIFDCAYCAQARTSFTSEKMLSRVVWPKFDMGDIVEAIEKYNEKIKRICLQVVSSERARDEAFEFLKRVKRLKIPISASVRVFSIEEAKRWFENGIERLGVATDVISKKFYAKYRGGDLGSHLNLLKELAETFPNRITTHAIVGLGESEKEMAEFFQKMHEWQITVGLFAFTPLKGTKLERHPKPSMDTYRRVQVARYLIENEISTVSNFSFSEKGEIIDYGMKIDNISPRAFLTSGCPNCTRPYYNEDPREELYNFFDRVKRKPFRVGDREV